MGSTIAVRSTKFKAHCTNLHTSALLIRNVRQKKSNTLFVEIARQ